MNAIRRTAQLNAQELEACTPPTASWHQDYKDTAYIYIGGLDTRLSEGDVLQIFSQYGEPVWIKLARDRETGKSRGFGWLKYEDQRSCDVAVDNLGGASVLGRLLNVDHTRYEARDGEDLGDNTVPPEDRDRKTGAVRGPGDVGTESEGGGSDADEEARPLLKEERELLEIVRTYDEDDPMKAYLVEKKKKEVEAAKKKVLMSVVKNKSRSKSNRKEEKHRRRRHRSRSVGGDDDVDGKDGERADRRRRNHDHGEENDRGASRRSRDDTKSKQRDEHSDYDEERFARRETRDRSSRNGDRQTGRSRSPAGQDSRQRRRRSTSGTDERDRYRHDRRDRA